MTSQDPRSGFTPAGGMPLVSGQGAIPIASAADAADAVVAPSKPGGVSFSLGFSAGGGLLVGVVAGFLLISGGVSEAEAVGPGESLASLHENAQATKPGATGEREVKASLEISKPGGDSGTVAEISNREDVIAVPDPESEVAAEADAAEAAEAEAAEAEAEAEAAAAAADAAAEAEAIAAAAAAADAAAEAEAIAAAEAEAIAAAESTKRKKPRSQKTKIAAVPVSVHIKFRVAGLADGERAVISLNGKSVSGTSTVFSLASGKTKQRVKLTVKARGYKVFRKTLNVSADMSVAVPMRKKTKAASSLKSGLSDLLGL